VQLAPSIKLLVATMQLPTKMISAEEVSKKMRYQELKAISIICLVLHKQAPVTTNLHLIEVEVMRHQLLQDRVQRQ
jgi:hypothetical protein